MTTMPTQYRKRPVVIEAMRWDGTAEGATPIIDWHMANSAGGGARFHDEDGGFIAIDTLEGTMRAVAGDWVIRGVANEFYPCKPAIFLDTYEPVPDLDADWPATAQVPGGEGDG